MDWILNLLKGIVEEIAEEVLGPALLVIVILVIAPPVFLIWRKMSGSKTTLGDVFWGGFTNLTNPPPMRPASPFIEELDKLRSGVETVYRYLLYGGIALVTGFVVFLFAALPLDSNRGFLLFYFGVGYLIFLLIAVGKVSALESERRRAGRASRRGAQQVRLDSALAFQFAPAISLPIEEKPDNDALDKAEQYLAINESLETVCRFVNPRFADWSTPMQQSYMECLRRALEERRSPQAGGAIREYIFVEPDAGSPPSILGLTPAQLILVVMVFGAALTVFLVLMLRSRF